MPTCVEELFMHAGIRLGGRVIWGQQIREDGPGVYVVAVTSKPIEKTNTYHKNPPLDFSTIQNWINSVPTLKLDGVRPKAYDLQQRLSLFWLPDEPVIYIGKAGTSLKNRVSQYYNTPLGAKRPHAGGHWIKTLSTINSLCVFWGACLDPEKIENTMLNFFVSNVSRTTKKIIYDPERPFPFANMEFPKGNKKKHGISGAVNRK